MRGSRVKALRDDLTPNPGRRYGGVTKDSVKSVRLETPVATAKPKARKTAADKRRIAAAEQRRALRGVIRAMRQVTAEMRRENAPLKPVRLVPR